MAAALGPDERAALPVVYADVLRQLAPLDPSGPDAERKDAELAGEIMRVIVNIKPELDERRRADWVSSQLADLDGRPFEIVREAVAAARLVTRYPGDFVPNVMSIVIPRQARLEAQRERYEALMKMAR